jgi:hypothetical protein
VNEINNSSVDEYNLREIITHKSIDDVTIDPSLKHLSGKIGEKPHSESDEEKAGRDERREGERTLYEISAGEKKVERGSSMTNTRTTCALP